MTVTATEATTSQDLSFALPETDTLYVGIDVAKASAVAAFISNALLEQHGRFERCPVMPFAQSRSGFNELAARIRQYVPSGKCAVLLESTGHYHKTLLQFLLEQQGCSAYIMHVGARPRHLDKTDRRDALGLANHIFNQVEKGIQLGDPKRVARPVSLPSDTAQRLKGLIQHHQELSRECTRRKNRLIGICDQLFPELTQVLKNPNLPTALELRELFPTPAAIANASLDDLRKIRHKSHFPNDTKLELLRQLAAQSIGVKNEAQLFSLQFEQTMLIKELRLFQAHLAALDVQIREIVEASREGQILLSLGVVGPVWAATILARIGNIMNFDSAAKLKSYFGWSPTQQQTGTSFDRSFLTQNGSRLLKSTMFLIALGAIREDTEWKVLYDRLVPQKCAWDAKTNTYKGKMKVIGRICGQLIEMIFALLSRDAELLAKVKPGEPVPPPKLYDREIHRAHREKRTAPRQKPADAEGSPPIPAPVA